MKIAHIITGLGDGGAEHTLYKICKYDIKNKHFVCSLGGKDKYFSLLSKLGIKVYCLNLTFFTFYKVYFLMKFLRSLKPDIVQTWLVHADLIGSLSAKLAGIKNIVWNIRYSNLEFKKTKLNTFIILQLLSKLSYFLPKLIIVVSNQAKNFYKKKGFDKNKLKFIPNGYDLSVLKVDKSKKKNLKKKFNTKSNITLIGKVARYDLLKDHSNLLNALSLVRLKNSNFLCILVGNKINNNHRLKVQINKLRLKKFVKLLPPVKSISEIMNVIDINIQSSSSEGFPNVIAEAMALETPCVATNVGDTSLIIGRTGRIVPPKDHFKLAEAILKSIYEFKKKKNFWKKKCIQSRLRIKTKFDISKMINAYNNSWLGVIRKNHK